jgi:hypothetical protein
VKFFVQRYANYVLQLTQDKAIKFENNLYETTDAKEIEQIKKSAAFQQGAIIEVVNQSQNAPARKAKKGK